MSSSMSTEPHTSSAVEHSGPTGLSNLLAVCRAVLMQARELLDDTITSDDHLTFQSRLMPGSTIGRHMRHARDHFDLLLQSVRSPPPQPLIFSYDKRNRDTPMEQSVAAAREAFSATVAQIDGLLDACETEPRTGLGVIRLDEGRELTLDEPMTLNAVTPDMQVLQTSVGRELWFAALHAVHHWSMVRVIAGELDLNIDGTFGVAPSTVLYRKAGEGSVNKSKM